MSEVLEKWPSWDRKVATVRLANITCVDQLTARLRQRAPQSSDRPMERMTLPRSAIANELPSCLYQWMQARAAIRRREFRLIQVAFTLDLGGEA
jgi:hypothetical protein